MSSAGNEGGTRALMNAGLVLLVFAVVPGLANPFNVPKEALLCLLAAFVCLAASVSPPSEILPLPRLPLAAFCAAIATVTLAALVNEVSVLASAGALRWWMAALYFVALRLAYRDAAAAEGMLDLIAATAAVEGVVVVWQVAFGAGIFDTSHLPSPKWRAFGTLGNPNWVGAFLAASLPLAVGRSIRRPRRAWDAATIIAIVAGLVLTLSRSSWLAAGASLLTLMMLAPGARGRRTLADFALGAAVGLAIASAAYGGGGLASDLGRVDSVAGRWHMWRVTADMIGERPFLGHGPGRFAGAYPAAQREFLVHRAGAPVVDLTDHPHDEYLYLGAEGGLLALAFFATGVGMTLWRARRPAVRTSAAPAAAALVALCVDALTDVPWHQPVTTALLCALLFSLLVTARGATPAPSHLHRVSRIALALAAIVALAQATRLLLVERSLTEARRAVASGALARSLPAAARGLSMEDEHGELWALVAQALAALGEDGEALAAADKAMTLAPNMGLVHFTVEVLRRLGRDEEAMARLRWWSEALPGLLRPRLLLGQMYAQSGRVAEARVEWERLLAIHGRFDGEAERQIRRQAVTELLRLPMRPAEP